MRGCARRAEGPSHILWGKAILISRATSICLSPGARALVRFIALVVITGPPFGDGHAATATDFPLGPWISVTEVDPAITVKPILELGSPHT